MVDLKISATWKDWNIERPKVGDYFFILGRTPYSMDETVLESLATFPKQLLMEQDPIIDYTEDGKYEIMGVGEPYPMICEGCHPLSENSELVIEYWILVEDIHPNFIK